MPPRHHSGTHTENRERLWAFFLRAKPSARFYKPQANNLAAKTGKSRFNYTNTKTTSTTEE